MDAVSQQLIDKKMIEIDGTANKSKIGGNAILSVSIAVAKASARSAVLPFFLYLREYVKKENQQLKMPTPCFNVINGGKHDDAAPGGASLSGVGKSRESGIARRRVKVGVIADNQSILTAEFQTNLGKARARNMLGHTLYRLGHYDAAIGVLDMALSDVGEDAARHGQILGDRALALSGLGHFEEAINEAGRAVALAPESATLQHVLGFVLHHAGRPAEALGPIQRALELEPGFTGALRTLAAAQTTLGQQGEAASMLRRALQRDATDRDTALQLSLLLIEGGQLEEALQVIEPCLKQAPDDAAVLNNQGLALRGLKRFDEARRALKRASRVATDDPFILTNLGCVLVDLGRAQEARPLHEQALRTYPGDSRLLGHYGVCLAALGDRDKARETLDAALAANPDNAQAMEARIALDA